VVAMTTRLPPSHEMAVKMYAHSLLGRDLTKESSYPISAKRRASIGPKGRHRDAPHHQPL